MFGDNNNYPNELAKGVSRCTILASIINATTDYVLGDNFDHAEVINKKGETMGDLVAGCVRDYLVYGAFAVQVLRNRLKEIAEYYRISPQYIRLDENDTTVYYGKQFAKGGIPRKYLTFERFVNDSNVSNSIYYYRRAVSDNDYYGTPLWATALQDVMTNIAISDYHYNSIKNDFSPSAIVNFNNGTPDEETQKIIERKLNEKFSGEDNASRLLISWNNDKEHGTTIERFQSDDFGERYRSLADTVRDNILASFRVSPQLVGINDYTTAFNSVEFEQSFKLFNRTVVNPMQTEIEKALAKIGIYIQFQPFIIQFDNAD